jgi:hypothetical protein
MRIVLPIDYEAPATQKRRSWPFWLAFAVAYLPGLMILDITDDVLHMRMTGNHNDGDIVILSLFASPFFAGIAAIMKAIWKRFDSLLFAVAFAILGPLLAYVLWVLPIIWK